MLEPEAVAEGVWRIPLPSKTLPPFEHTNSYVVKCGQEAVLIDAGAGDSVVLGELAELLGALGVARLKALLLTHTHPDHAAGAAALRERYGLEVYVHPLEHARLDVPAERLVGGETVNISRERLDVHHTPGHSPGHLSFSLSDRVVFVGDLLNAQSSTWVGLPEGDVADYLASLNLLETLVGSGAAVATVFAPGHGPPVGHPTARLEQVRAHRLAREAEIFAALTPDYPQTLEKLKAHIYPGLQDALVPMAEGTLLAHLEKLRREGRVVQTRADDDKDHNTDDNAAWVAAAQP